MFLEEIETVAVEATVEEVRPYDRSVKDEDGALTDEKELMLAIRLLDPRKPQYYSLQMSAVEIREQGFDAADIVVGLGCRVLAERSVMRGGQNAGQYRTFVKKVLFGSAGARLQAAREGAVAAEAGQYAAVGARLDAKLNGAAVAVAAEDTPF